MQIFDSYIQSGQKIKNRRNRADFYMALIEFIAYGVEPDLEGTADIVFTAIRPSLEKSRAKAKAGRAGGEAGAGKPKQRQKQNEKQTQSRFESKDPEREKAKGICMCNTQSKTDCVCETPAPALPDAYPDGSAPPRGAARYPRPDPAQVEAFVAASGCGCSIDGAAFCGWYDDHGWPPVGWQNTALRWAREDRDRRAKDGRRARPETGEVRADERAVAEELAQFRAV